MLRGGRVIDAEASVAGNDDRQLFLTGFTPSSPFLILLIVMDSFFSQCLILRPVYGWIEMGKLLLHAELRDKSIKIRLLNLCGAVAMAPHQLASVSMCMVVLEEVSLIFCLLYNKRPKFIAVIVP